MAELKNRFTWSYSAADEFESCRRKRYWSKYAGWGGWEATAPEVARKAYQLSKMMNIYTLTGVAAEKAVMWSLRRLQAGQEVTAREAYEAAARPYLNEVWRSSRQKLWKQDPKRYACLREHYYGQWDAETERRWVEKVKSVVNDCVTHFVELVWPRLREVRHEQELVTTATSGTRPEPIEVDSVPVYAVPDYAYQAGEDLHIHDWKSGQPRESHRQQLSLYGLWAHRRFGTAPEKIVVFVEYLQPGEVVARRIGKEDLQEITAFIRSSVADMAEYLVDGDIQRNEPLPLEEWEAAADTGLCRHCNFYELCEPYM